MRAEGFRTIRTSLQYVDVDGAAEVGRHYVWRSPTEGRPPPPATWRHLAQAGAKVCLVEADLQETQWDCLGIDGSVGLTSVLTGRTLPRTSLVTWRRGLLSVVPSGPIPPSCRNCWEPPDGQPAELAAGTVRRGDRRARPASLPVTDAAVLARNADSAIPMTRFGATIGTRCVRRLKCSTTSAPDCSGGAQLRAVQQVRAMATATATDMATALRLLAMARPIDRVSGHGQRCT